MEKNNNTNKLLWLALIGLGAYHLYSKGFRIGKFNSNREDKGNGAFASGGGGFMIPILNTRIYRKEEVVDKEPELVAKEGAVDTLKEINSVSDEEAKTALANIEKDLKINPEKLPTTTMGMETTTKTTSPKINTTSSLSTTELSSVKLGSLEPLSSFMDFNGVDFDGDDMDSRQWVID
jgi:hypothetical protein